MRKVMYEKYETKHADFMEFYKANEENRGFYSWVVCGLFDHHQWAVAQTADGAYLMVLEWNKFFKELTTRYHRILTNKKHGAHFKREGRRFRVPKAGGNSWSGLMIGRI